jgi:cell division protein FtsB
MRYTFARTFADLKVGATGNRPCLKSAGANLPYMSTQPATKANAATGPQRRGRRIIGALVAFVACVLVLDALVGDHGLIATMRAHKQYERLEHDLSRLRAENAALREDVRRLRYDAATIEEIARRELGLMSPGEKLFIIKDIPPPAAK